MTAAESDFFGQLGPSGTDLAMVAVPGAFGSHFGDILRRGKMQDESHRNACRNGSESHRLFGSAKGEHHQASH
jgi:hypothetical protein